MGMKGFRFYLEYDTPAAKRRREHNGTVLALGTETEHELVGGMETISALLFEPNSPVCGGSTNRDYLSRYTRRISEREARQIHPALFARLDQPDE